ncbi:hypothetical protein U9M48_033814 [Paspalum notatum var. saurae]|uniref:Uncharacterized protein n=1 Tax=Paspalum notatum var. saurae TaxID=547442 RepID=A0AAQ3UC94_PASNO
MKGVHREASTAVRWAIQDFREVWTRGLPARATATPRGESMISFTCHNLRSAASAEEEIDTSRVQIEPDLTYEADR